MAENDKKNLKENIVGEAVDNYKNTVRIEQGFFSYKSSDEAKLAASEADAIGKLNGKIDYNRPQTVHILYDKIIDQNMLHSPEGTTFLIELRTYLEDNLSALDHPVKGIPSEKFNDPDAERKGKLKGKLITVADAEKRLDRIRNARKRDAENFRKSKLTRDIIIVFLAACILAMLVISGLSDTPSILNYENELQDKYADWETELNERESAVRAKEKELGITSRE